MAKKKLSRVSVSMVLLTLLTSGLHMACRTSTLEPDQVTIHLKWYHQAQFAGIYVAEQKGVFADENIEVTITPGGGTAPPIPAVLNGDAQFGVAGAADLIRERAKGEPIVALAVIFQKSPVCFIAMADSGIQRPQDFVGRRVGVEIGLGAGDELSYRVMMANVGVDMSQVIEVPQDECLTPFLEGELDVMQGYVINEPDTLRGMGHDINVILAADYGFSLAADTLFTTEDMLAQNPSLVRRFVQATLKGWTHAITHPAEGVDAVMVFAPGSDREHQEAMLKAAIHLITPCGIELGAIDAASWQKMHDVLLDYGMIDRAVGMNNLFSPDYSE